MGKGFEKTSLHKYTNTHEKMFNIICYQENANKNYNDLSIHIHKDGYKQKGGH